MAFMVVYFRTVGPTCLTRESGGPLLALCNAVDL